MADLLRTWEGTSDDALALRYFPVVNQLPEEFLLWRSRLNSGLAAYEQREIFRNGSGQSVGLR